MSGSPTDSPSKTQGPRLAWLLCLVVPLITLYAGQRYTVNVPKWDDWPIVGQPLLEYVNGTFGSEDLFGQIVDNRMPVSRAIFLALAIPTDWNAHAHTTATWVFALLAAAAMVFGARRTWPDNPWKVWTLALVTSVLMFSPTGWMLWTFCPFMANTQMVACILWAAMLAAAPPDHQPWKFPLAVVLAMLASWTYLSGWLIWGLLIWLVLGWVLAKQVTLPRALAYAAVLAIVVMVGAWGYFRGYHFEGKPGLAAKLVENPLRYVLFYLRWLGAPFGDLASLTKDELRMPWDRGVAAIFGAVGLAGFTWLSLRVARNPGHRQRAWQWWAIALWGLASGGLVTIGRIELSEDAAFWPRYQLFAMLFWIPLVALALLVPWPKPKPAARVLAVCLAAMSCALFASTLGAWEDMRADFLASLNVRAGLQMMEVAPTPLPLHKILPGGFHQVEAMAIPLAAKGYLAPGILNDKDVANAPVHSDSARYQGALESGSVSVDGKVEMKGWAYDTKAHRPVDAVVLSCQSPGAPEQWFGIACKFSDGKKRADKLGLRGRFARINWTYIDLPPGLPHEHADVAPMPRAPATGGVFRAYLLDTSCLRFTRLPGEVTFAPR